MAHVEVTTEGWLARLMKSFVKVAAGGALFFTALLVLFFNEGRAVQSEKSLNEGAGAVRTVPADKVDAKFEGKLVHLTGEARTAQTLSDPDFKVSVSAIKLERKVEMYQWEESKHTKERKLSGGKVEKTTTYDYKKTWSSRPIDSSAFSEGLRHSNPPMPYQGEHWTAEKVSLGAFTLTPALIEKFANTTELPIGASEVKAVPKELHAKLDATSFYLGVDPSDPQIGDVRVSYVVVKPGPASVVAVQSGSSFAPWPAPSGDPILLLETGTHSAAHMFAQAQSDNVAATWLLRILGWTMMFIGLRMVFKPLVVIADVVPLVGTALEAGLGLFAFVVASSLSTFVMGLAWLFFRPLAGLILLLVAGGAGFALFRYGRAKGAKKRAAMDIKVEHTEIERQSPHAVTLPITDSVVKGKFVVSGAQQASVTSMKAELVMQLKLPDGRDEQVVLGTDEFPDKYTSRSDDMLKYPFALTPGTPVEDFFIISMRDPKTNTSFTIADELKKRGAKPEQASFFVRTSVQVQGLPARPEARSPISIVQ